MPVNPSVPSLIAFLMTVAWVCLALVLAVRVTARPEKRDQQTLFACLGVGAWMLFTAAPTWLGWITIHTVMPLTPMLMVLWMGIGVGFAFSPLGGRIANGVPLFALVGFHVFRLPLELILHAWVDAGVIPPQMTWTGANPDILAGVFALVLAPFASRHRAVPWVALLIGSVLLANVIRVVVVSMPVPFRQYETIVPLAFGVPTVWIASVNVVGAMIVHLLLFRRLLSSTT